MKQCRGNIISCSTRDNIRTIPYSV